MTNAVTCHPPDERGLTAGELAARFEHLGAELRAVDPAVVAATGRHATTLLPEREGHEPGQFTDHVWVARLGDDSGGCREAVGEQLADLM